jgi:phosphatidylglycerol:prolipoprotein diacylglycerol transferase
MHPELFHIGDFPVNTYGLLMALAFVAALLVASKLAARDGLLRERVYDLGLWMLLAGLLGSKLMLLWTEADYRQNPKLLLSLDFFRSAGVWYGGFLAALVVGYFLMRRYGLSFWRVADVFAPGIALGQAIGRQGCFAAGCCWGKPTAAWCGVHFTDAGHENTGVPVIVAHLTNPEQQSYWAQKLGNLAAPLHLHPTQLYESFFALALFGFLLWLHRRKRFDGQILLVYGAAYGAFRFVNEFFRDNLKGELFGLVRLTGLSVSQFISLAIVLSCLFLYLKRRRATDTAPAAA